jgi:hypothetical protein
MRARGELDVKPTIGAGGAGPGVWRDAAAGKGRRAAKIGVAKMKQFRSPIV